MHYKTETTQSGLEHRTGFSFSPNYHQNQIWLSHEDALCAVGGHEFLVIDSFHDGENSKIHIWADPNEEDASYVHDLDIEVNLNLVEIEYCQNEDVKVWTRGRIILLITHINGLLNVVFDPASETARAIPLSYVGIGDGDEQLYPICNSYGYPASRGL